MLFFVGLTAQAQADSPASVLKGQIPCGVVTDVGSGDGIVAGSLGQVWCGTVTATDNTSAVTTPSLGSVRSTAKSFDGVPLDINFAMPDPAQWGPPPYPTVMNFHGYGQYRLRFKGMQRYLSKGYAVYSITARGSGESCLTPGSKAADPTGCAKGYIHLLDQRFEIRDTQNFIGELVDEGFVQPDHLAATGISYGGGHTLSFAALKDRMMEPDGSLVPWKSPGGTPISITVAVAEAPPTELPFVLAPSGSDLDYIVDSSYHYVTQDGTPSRPGVLKEGWVQGLTAVGFTAPAGTDPKADMQGWTAAFEQGEPYDGKQSILDPLKELAKYHSPYGIDHSEAPAPTMIVAGYTDDLVPVKEELRFYDRTHTQYPDLPFTLFFGSLGHPRGQAQANVTATYKAKEDQWIDHYLGGSGPAPQSEVISYTQTCPNGTDAGGPYAAADWAALSPGEIRVRDAATQTIGATGGDSDTALGWNSLIANQNPCGTAPGAPETGSADWSLPPAPAGGYTMQGSPTLVADIDLGNAPNSEIAARLVDLSPDGSTKTLVARGVWRPWPKGIQVFQLHANAWKVEQGHVLRLELLPKDASQPAGTFMVNSFRPADGQGDVKVSGMDLRIPVVEKPGALGGLVTAPAKKVLPDRRGVKLVPWFDSIGAVTIDAALKSGARGKVKGRALKITLRCPASYTNSCPGQSVTIKGAPKKGKGKGLKLTIPKKVTIAGGKNRQIALRLTGKARNLFRDRRKKVRRRGKSKVKTVKGPKSLRVAVLLDGKRVGYATVKRTGKVR